jgi:hypothetical protein
MAAATTRASSVTTLQASRLVLAVALAATAAAGCRKKAAAGSGKAAGEPAHVAGTPHPDDVVGAWKKEGLEPASFQLADPAEYKAAYCAEGSVGGVEALICEYADDESVDRGTQTIQTLWESQGVTTSVVVRTKHTVLALVDRGKADPDGKTISRLVGAFRKM